MRFRCQGIVGATQQQSGAHTEERFRESYRRTQPAVEIGRQARLLHQFIEHRGAPLSFPLHHFFESKLTREMTHRKRDGKKCRE